MMLFIGAINAYSSLSSFCLAMQAHADEKLPDPLGALTMDLLLSAIFSIHYYNNRDKHISQISVYA